MALRCASTPAPSRPGSPPLQGGRGWGRPLDADRGAILLSSTVGGSAGQRMPLLRGAWPRRCARRRGTDRRRPAASSNTTCSMVSPSVDDAPTVPRHRSGAPAQAATRSAPGFVELQNSASDPMRVSQAGERGSRVRARNDRVASGVAYAPSFDTTAADCSSSPHRRRARPRGQTPSPVIVEWCISMQPKTCTTRALRPFSRIAGAARSALVSSSTEIVAEPGAGRLGGQGWQLVGGYSPKAARRAFDAIGMRWLTAVVAGVQG